MNKQPSRIGLYLVLLVALVAGYFYLNNQVVSQSSYTQKQLEQALEETEWLMQRFSRTERFLPVQ